MSVKLLTGHHLEFLSLQGGCTGFSDSTHVKMLIVGNHFTAQLSSRSDFTVTAPGTHADYCLESFLLPDVQCTGASAMNSNLMKTFAIFLNHSKYGFECRICAFQPF